MKHAEFSPSASERWITCPGSHLRAKGLPPAPATVYSDRGTLLHDLAAIGLKETTAAMDVEARKSVPDLTSEERDAIVLYVNFCRTLRRGAKVYGVEKRFDYNAALWGTLDFCAVVGDVLHVVDLKTGRGVYVEAQDNPQLLTYALMVFKHLARQCPDIAAGVNEVRCHIVQPLYESAPPIRAAAYPTTKLVPEWQDTLNRAMTRAQTVDAPLVPGEHCRFCPVKAVCPALQGLATSLPAPDAQTEMTVQQLSEWLTKADAVEQWISALRDFAHETVAKGIVIPGWKLVDKRATRKWTDEDKVLAAVKKLGWHAQELKLLSPAQLEKKYDGLPGSLEKLIDQRPSGQNLVKDPVTAGALTDEQRQLKVALSNLQYRV